MGQKYYLGAIGLPEKEVTKEQFMAAEQAAGFRSKFPGQPATGGFSGGGMSGRVVYVPADPVPEPELEAGDEDQRRSDHKFYTRQLLTRAAVAMGEDPNSITWFDVVDKLEELLGVKS